MLIALMRCHALVVCAEVSADGPQAPSPALKDRLHRDAAIPSRS